MNFIELIARYSQLIVIIMISLIIIGQTIGYKDHLIKLETEIEELKYITNEQMQFIGDYSQKYFNQNENNVSKIISIN